MRRADPWPRRGLSGSRHWPDDDYGDGFRNAAGGGASGEGPLLGAMLGQELVAKAAAIAEPTGRECHEFGIHRGGIRPAELRPKT